MGTVAITLVLDMLAKHGSTTMLGTFSTTHNPWKILIGTILSARTRDEVTEEVCKELFARYPTVKALAAAKERNVQKSIKRIGFYKNKARYVINASKQIINKYDGRVPETMEGLCSLPGAGRKVAGCVLVYAFQKDAIPVDTHVHRISNRLGLVKTTTPEQTEKRLMNIVPRQYWQAVNDTLVSHGKRVCKPITPLCSTCVVEKYCKKVGVQKKRESQ